MKYIEDMPNCHFSYKQFFVFSCRKIIVQITTPLRIIEPQIIQKMRTSSLGKSYLVLYKKECIDYGSNNAKINCSALFVL